MPLIKCSLVIKSNTIHHVTGEVHPNKSYILTMHILYLINPLKISIYISNIKNVDTFGDYSYENFVSTHSYKTKQNILDIHSSDTCILDLDFILLC